MRTAIVDKFTAGFLESLAPPRCHWCGTRTRAAPVCEGCRQALPWNENACRTCAIPIAAGAGVCGECLKDAPAQDSSWTAFRYEAPVSEQIVGLKFHERLACGHLLGTLMAQKLAARPAPLPECLIPVPLHPRRLRQRGYNQAVEIARAIVRVLPVQLAPDAVQRVRATAEQSRLDAAGRRRNVRNAFAVDASVRGRHVALLDDVITTGATVRELASAARDAGARTVEAWAAARVA